MLRFLLTAILVGQLTGAARAQAVAWPEDVPDDLARPTRAITGNEILFCVNATSMLADFERVLAAEIAGTLLLNYRIVDINPVTPTDRYDFRLPLIDGEIYLFLAHKCDAIMGMTAAADYPAWLAPSPIYLETNTVLVTRSPYAAMADLPRHAVIGARILSLAAGALTSYLRTLPEGSSWTHILYPNNKAVLDRLMSGDADAVLLWGPAVPAYIADHPEAPPVSILETLAFPIGHTQFVLGLRPNEQFFNFNLSQAITALRQAGVIDRLAREYRLVVPEQ